jgi:hypothetical protein
MVENGDELLEGRGGEGRKAFHSRVCNLCIREGGRMV